METYNLKSDKKVFGLQVKSFPNGVGETFEKLIKMLPADDERAYFGKFFQDKNGNMLYYATAEETFPGEAAKYNCESQAIEGGHYLVEVVRDWKKKTESIKDVFEQMNHDDRVDKSKPGIEWYRDEKEMWCMLRERI